MKVDSKLTKTIFEKRIWSSIKENCTPQTNPKAYVLGGQPGAGKSNLLKSAKQEMGGNLVVINADEFRQLHPEFKRLQKENGINAVYQTADFSGEITGLALEKAMSEGYNVAVEGTFRTADTPINTLEGFKGKGYETTVMIATCPKDVSWTSTLNRYCELAEANEPARYTPKPTHDIVVDTIATNTQKVLDSGLADHMKVFNREGKLMDTGNGALDASTPIEKELHRPLTPNEHQMVIQQYTRLETLQSKQGAPAAQKKETRSQKNAYLLRSQDKETIKKSPGLYKIQKDAERLAKSSNRTLAKVVSIKAKSIEKGTLRVPDTNELGR